MKTLPRRLHIKYLVDRVVAPVVAVAISPVLAAIGVGIWLGDGGNIFFRQERVGEDGKVFKIWKFRTMKANAEQIGLGYVPPGSNLVTRTGAFLRKTSLDELPQIFNIMRGEMSLVGPRPALPDQVARYTQTQRRRFEVRPGIAGWAQLHGRNLLPWRKRIEYDIEYVARASLSFDLYILARTIPMVLRGSGVADWAQKDLVDDLATTHPEDHA